MQPSNTFKIQTIELKDFSFKQTNKLLKGITACDVKINLETGYKKENDDTIVVQVRASLKILQSIDNKESELAEIYSIIFCTIKPSENFKMKLLNNVVAIMYSYLRPIVAQMTVMAKLPPLDLPPVNLNDLNVEEINDGAVNKK